MVKLRADTFAKLHEFVFGQVLTSFEVSRELLTVSVDEDLNNLEELVLDDDLLVLGKDIENVAYEHVLVVAFFR